MIAEFESHQEKVFPGPLNLNLEINLQLLPLYRELL